MDEWRVAKRMKEMLELLNSGPDSDVSLQSIPRLDVFGFSAFIHW